MKTFTLLISALLLGTVAHAKTAPKRDLASEISKAHHILCSWTEPFFSIDVNIRTKAVKVTSPMGDLMDGKIATERTDEISDVTSTIGGGVWTFVYAPKGVDTKIEILKVDTKKKGSDGMSDKVYDAEGSTAIMGTGANNGIGGCNFIR
jgi:uncharacterized membrane protein